MDLMTTCNVKRVSYSDATAVPVSSVERFSVFQLDFVVVWSQHSHHLRFQQEQAAVSIKQAKPTAHYLSSSKQQPDTVRDQLFIIIYRM